MKRTVILLVLVILLLLTGRVLAVSTDNYRLDWFTPLTTNGGGSANSANYIVNLTIGQSVIGTDSSTNYHICLGYWCGAAGQYKVYLPLVLRNF